MLVQYALQQDPKLRDHLARKGEKKNIDSLRAMAANSDTQGIDALEDLFGDYA